MFRIVNYIPLGKFQNWLVYFPVSQLAIIKHVVKNEKESGIKKNTHKSLKIILFIIFSRGTAPLACLNAMLHHHSRGPNDLFIKVEGRMSCYKLNVCKLISVCFN